VLNDTLIVRVGADQHAAAMIAPHARPFDLTGQAMKGWVMVSSEGCASDDDLAGWVRQGVEFAQSLPRKYGSAPKITLALPDRSHTLMPDRLLVRH
jgi:hypothetical protein